MKRSVTIIKSGGAKIITIPKAITKTLNLKVGDKLDLSIQNNSIVLSPVKHKLTLEELLAGSPKACFELTKEDREWINVMPQGKEV